MSIEPHRVGGYCVHEPYRVMIDGQLVRNKKGNPKKFKSAMDALSWGQRHLQKKERERVQTLGADSTGQRHLHPQKKEWEKAQTLGADVTGQRHLQKKDLEKRK